MIDETVPVPSGPVVTFAVPNSAGKRKVRDAASYVTLHVGTPAMVQVDPLGSAPLPSLGES